MPNADPQVIANPQRLARLRNLNLLDTPADPAFDRLTNLATLVLQAPISLVTLVDAHRQFFKSQVGLGEPWASRREMPLDYSYCQHAVASGEPLVINDTQNHPLVFDSPATTEEGLLSYAGIPLITSDGVAIGTFCVADRKQRVWTADELAILTDLAASVMTEIELQGELAARHRMEDALRKSEQHLQAVVSSAPMIFYVVDLAGIFQMFDGKQLQVANIDANEFLGRSVFEIYTERPELLNAIRAAFAGTSSAFQSASLLSAVSYEYEINVSPLYDIDNQISGALIVANNITEIVAIEHELEATIQRLTLLRRIEVELSESLDLDSVLTIAMDTAQRATGAENGVIGLIDGDRLRIVHAAGAYANGDVRDFDSGIIGRTLRTLQPQLVLDVDNDPDYVREIPGMKAQMTIPLIHRDHLIGALSLETARPRFFTEDAFDFLTLIAGHITVSIDNSQLYQVSQQQLDELHQLYMRVSELEQLKTDMIRIAAHDLRNPLSLISGYVELLKEDEATLTEDQESFIQAIDKAQRKMFKIIDDILSLQRIEAAQDNKHCEEIDLALLVRDLFASNDSRARQKTQKYELALPDKPVVVCIDVAQLREAVDNLIGNAIKYTPVGGSVRVVLKSDGKHAIFDVEDTGLGIPEDQQGRLFQPFFRASNAKQSQIEGTGLGLHLVKNIIERHGGRMRFKSVLGQGSRFGFEMPIG